jgi:hypothetical protein
VAVAVMGWLFWSTLIIGSSIVSTGHWWPPDVPMWHLAYPILAVLAFLVIARWKTSTVSGRAAAEKLKRYGAMWQSLYGASWLLALGLQKEALWIGLFAVVGFTLMTLIKEVTGITGTPISYRV